ncbi:Uncharacterised protein [Mycobacteroides abscessus subsp. abscessus]|nr:Uncharacterised protein [Mycobacteroides abscessus subsp. abscessus]
MRASTGSGVRLTSPDIALSTEFARPSTATGSDSPGRHPSACGATPAEDSPRPGLPKPAPTMPPSLRSPVPSLGRPWAISAIPSAVSTEGCSPRYPALSSPRSPMYTRVWNG